MSWASGRRTLILTFIGLVVIAGLIIFGISVFYKTPSCSDGKQNQDETGVDCGGSCNQVCKVDAVAPVVSFVRALPQQNGRVDVIAYIENPNPGVSARGVEYTVELFSEERVVLASLSGAVDLPPRSSIPVFIPNAYANVSPVAQAFLTISDTSFVWNKDVGEYLIFPVSNIQRFDSNAPRITATISNPTAKTIRSLPVVATLFNAEDIVIAASRTVVDVLPPQGSANIVFTWNLPFSDTPARIDIKPALLPSLP